MKSNSLLRIYILRSLIFLGCGDVANAQVHADSVADFSGIQGHNNWYYGYYDKTHDADGVYNPVKDFVLMPQYKSNGSVSYYSNGPAWYASDGQVWTSLWANGSTGNGLITSYGRQSTDQFAIRRWVSDFTGTINISGNLAKLDTDPNPSSNGIVGYVTVDGKLIYLGTFDD